MKIKIPYPEVDKVVDIPDKNILMVGMPKEIPKMSNVRAKVLETIRSPLGADPLSKGVRAGMTICLLVDDFARETPVREVLPTVIEELRTHGVREKDIKIWIASGTHRAMTVDEQKRKVGEDIYQRFETRVHNCKDTANLTFLGKASHGTPMWVNKAVVESDIIIGIGGILVHPEAGYGGGAKIILPGVSGRETVAANHNILESTCSACNLDANPMREEMEEMARKAGLYMKIDCVMNNNNELVDLCAGDFITEHREAVRKYKDIYGVTFPEKAKILLTSSMPKYKTFTQGMVPLCTARDITTDDSTIIIDSPSIGGFTFDRKWGDDVKARLTIEQLRHRVKEGSIFEAIAMYHFARIREERNVIIVSQGVTEEEMIQTGFKHASTIEEALEKAWARHGKDTKVAVLPYGTTSVPMLAN